MVYNINEIFYSIQGEGANTGMPAIFIRFAGCNLNCWFCDTDFSIQQEMSLDDIISNLEAWECSNIVLTGGEPLLQVDDYFIKELRKEGYKLYLETNGTRPIPKGLDWVTVSPKGKLNLVGSKINELKIINEPHITDDILKGWETNFKFDYMFLQPCDDAKHHMNIDETIDMVKRNPKWRLSIQTQKLIDIK